MDRGVIQLDDRDFEEALGFISGVERGIPVRFRPAEQYHLCPANAWDRWENSRYQRHMPACAGAWNSRISFVKRYFKLREKRAVSATYWRKTERNYRAYLARKRKPNTHRFEYIGTKFIAAVLNKPPI